MHFLSLLFKRQLQVLVVVSGFFLPFFCTENNYWNCLSVQEKKLLREKTCIERVVHFPSPFSSGMHALLNKKCISIVTYFFSFFIFSLHLIATIVCCCYYIWLEEGGSGSVCIMGCNPFWRNILVCTY